MQDMYKEMKLQELNNWLKDLFNIIVDLHISLNNARYLIKEQGSETEESIKKIGFFKHHIHQLKFIAVIQLCKIFDKRNNQKINVNKLFNKLRNEGYDAPFENLLSKNSETKTGLKSKQELIEWVDYLEQEISKEANIIGKIVTLRDEVYAHYDPNKVQKDVYWNELESLIKLASKCYNEIYGNLYDCDTRFEITLDWEVRRVVQNFAWNRDLNKKRDNQ